MAGIPEAIRNPEVKFRQHFINNEFVDSKSGKVFPAINPSIGEKICDIADGQAEDIDAAVAAAREAFEFNSPWRQMDPHQRGLLLFKLAELIERDRQYLASLDTLNVGKPYTAAYAVDLEIAVRDIRFNGGMADKICGKTIPTEGPFFAYTRKEAIGVVGAIVPWNFPTMLAAFKLGPALAAGCTVVLKPAEQSPLTALYLASLCKEAGFPPGVVNVVAGYGPTAGGPLAAHPDVDKITFTGSTVVGRLIAKAAADSNLKRVTLELGGKSPNVICEDCDFDYAVEVAHQAVFFNMGEVCIAGTRCFVHESIYDKFVEASVARAKKRTVGDPFDPANEQGAQIEEEAMAKIEDLVASGKKEGARLLIGGKRMKCKGLFYEPTIFADVTDDMRIAKEEIFGPVMSILKFKTLDEVIKRANKTTYGLAGAVFSQNIDTVNYVAHGIRAGTVWVNTYGTSSNAAPFGGYKGSGWGREKGFEGIDAFLENKAVFVKLTAKNS